MKLRFLALLVLFNLALATDDDITCTKSGMCSLAHVKYFYGSIMTSEGFKQALEDVSYKKELILVTTFGSKYLEFVFQLHNQFRRLGLGHFLAMSFEEEGCQEVKTAGEGVANISCAWDDSPMHKHSWGGGPRLWHLRWRFLARAARIGYNILSLDSDYMVLQDPYAFLKQPPLSEVNLLSGGMQGCGMNGGFVYIQNTKPDGPVSWLYHRTTEVPLRWMDDGYNFSMALGKQGPDDSQCMTFDQSFLDDSLHSTLAGKHIYMNALGHCTKEDWVGPDGSKRPEYIARQGHMVQCDQNMKAVPAPAPHEFPRTPELPSSSQQIVRATLKVPNWEGKVDNSFYGGPIFYRGGGPYTDLYFKQLKQDCPDTEGKCPWWKEERAEDAAIAINTTEVFAFVPKWMSTSASHLNHGFLTPPDGSRPRQIMVHFHYLPFSKPPWKMAAAKVYGGFDYKLSKALHANPKAHAIMDPGPYSGGRIPDRVIVISPYILLNMTKDQMDFKRVLAGLVQLAILSNRTLVYPDVPCNTAWAYKNKDQMEGCDGSKLLHPLPEIMPYASRDEPWNSENLKKSFKLVSAFIADKDCLGPVPFISGLMNIEFEEWLAHDADTDMKAPMPDNTIFYHPKIMSPGQKSGGMVGAVTPMVDVDEMVAELERFADKQVLYVGHPVVVELSEADTADVASQHNNWGYKFKQVLEGCRAMYYDPYKVEGGTAKVEQYVYGHKATIQRGFLVKN